MADGVQIKIPVEILNHLWPGDWPPCDYLPLWFDHPNILAIHTIQPCEPTLWHNTTCHELILATNSFHAATTHTQLQQPNQAVALHFTTGGGSLRVLNVPSCCEYFYTPDPHGEHHFWRRVTRRDTGQWKPGSRRAGLSRKQNNRLHLPITHCPRLNHPTLKPRIETAIAQLYTQARPVH